MPAVRAPSPAIRIPRSVRIGPGVCAERRAGYRGRSGPSEDDVVAWWMAEAVPGRVLRGRAGESVGVVHPGVRNRHDGPDFLDAVLRIDGRERSGTVEVHVRSSDWRRHGHDGDARYRGVVLHVVVVDDAPPHGGAVCVALSENSSVPMRTALARIRSARSAELPLACAGEAHLVGDGPFAAMVVLAGAARLARKIVRVREGVGNAAAGSSAARQEFYRSVARALGYGGNEAAFEHLARRVPLRRLHGADGALLERVAFEDPIIWRAVRVRPGNRAARRVRALAMLAGRIADDAWWRALGECLLDDDVRGASSYPRTAALFAVRGDAGVGPERVSEILVNAVAPHLAASEGPCAEAAVRLYFRLSPAPANRHTRAFAAVFPLPSTLDAGRQQGMVELAVHRCAAAACASCLVGRALV